ncbi:MAG: hypothetical protein AAF745_17310 [Planctomycetota bacterium]
MPIQIKCGCGKALRVRDELAGKAVKCPGCGKAIRVPGKAAGGAGRSKNAGTAARPAATGVSAAAAAPAFKPTPKPSAAPQASNDSLDDLFAEEGMDRHVAAVCPACRAEMAADAVLCTKCGFNKQTGEKIAGYHVAGVDVDMGTVALQRAETMMARDKKLQEDMVGKAGMPAWMIALILFILGSAVGIAVIAVNASKREESIGFKPMQMFMNLGGTAFGVVAIGAVLSLIVKAFKNSKKDGFLSLTIVYLFYFAFVGWRKRGKALLTALICGGAAGGFFAAASTM